MVLEGSVAASVLETLLLALIVASWIYWLVACFLVFYFFRRGPGNRARGPVAREAAASPAFTPPVSILKPVRCLDAQAFENFASFCRQDYPVFELLFGVEDAADPVVPVIERLQREFPECRIRLLVTEPLGPNRKAGILHGLVAEAAYEILVISDSDMRVTPDYLGRVVAPLADEAIGLVTCPYRGAAALTFTARLEALHMGVTFLPSVMVARKFLAMRFAMGATVALRRADLERIGGFASIADYLADDFQLAVKISALGRRVCLSDYVVVSVLGATSLLEQWNREVRWARTNRVNRPREYPGMLLTLSTPLAALLVPITGYAPSAWRVLLASILLRWVVGWVVTGCTGDSEARRWLIWLPVRDMFSGLVWAVGGIGRRVVWRGQEYFVLPDGRLQPVVPIAARPEPYGRGQPVE